MTSGMEMLLWMGGRLRPVPPWLASPEAAAPPPPWCPEGPSRACPWFFEWWDWCEGKPACRR